MQFVKVGSIYINLDCVRKVVAASDGSLRIHMNGELNALAAVGDEAKAVLDAIAPTKATMPAPAKK